MFPNDCTPTEKVTLTYELDNIKGSPAVPIHLTVFGVEFYTDLLRRDLRAEAINPPFRADVWTFSGKPPQAREKQAA